MGAEIGQLARNHDFDSHHCEFARDTREVDQRLAELLAVGGVLHPDIKRRRSDSDGPRCCLDASAFEGLHQLLEPFAGLAAQQIVARDVKAVKGQLVFLHAAVAQNLDLAADHAVGGEGLGVGARGLFGQKHRQAFVVGRVRVGACEQGHHMGSGGVGDPRFVARDLPIVAFLNSAGAQRPQVRACVRLGKDGRGQRFGRGDARKPLLFLRLGATAEDQFGGDLGPGAERADANIAARQFFGDNAHRGFRQAKTAVFLWNGQTKDAHFGQLFDDLHRDQLVLEVPVVRVWFDFFDTKAAELLADHLKFIVKARDADGDIGGLFLHQRDKTGARGLGICVHHKGVDLGGHCGGDAHVVQADHFALVHLDAAVNLGEIFAKGNLMQELLCFAKLSVSGQALGPCLHLVQRLGISRQPCEAVRGGLVGLDQRRGNAAVFGHQSADIGLCLIEQNINGRQARSGLGEQVVQEGCSHHRHILSVVCHVHLRYCAVAEIRPSQLQRNIHSKDCCKMNENVAAESWCRSGFSGVTGGMNMIFELVTPQIFVVCLAIGLAAGMVKGLVGFAMPMVMISGMSMVLPPEIALAGLILPTLVTNGMQAFRQGGAEALRSMRRFRVFLGVGAVVLIGSAQLVRVLSADVIFLIIGGSVTAFVVMQLAGWAPKVPEKTNALEASIGAFAGFIGGLSGVWGPPTVAYLTAINTPKAEQMRVQGAIYGMGAVVLFFAHIKSGIVSLQTLPFSAALIVPAVIGMMVGLRLQDRIEQAAFKRMTLVVLLVGGLNLIRKGVMG